MICFVVLPVLFAVELRSGPDAEFDVEVSCLVAVVDTSQDIFSCNIAAHSSGDTAVGNTAGTSPYFVVEEFGFAAIAGFADLSAVYLDLSAAHFVVAGFADEDFDADYFPDFE